VSDSVFCVGKDDDKEMDSTLVQKLVTFFGPLLFALCFHEYAHGLVAKWRGDNTAERLGRLTLNPMAHADMMGTVIFPIMSIILGAPFIFGWAKPVPVETRNLKNVRTDMFWIALAGPLSNIFLAIVTTILWGIILKFQILPDYKDGISSFAQTFIGINVLLAIFNLVPLHPLDGGKVLARFLPASVNYKLEQNEQISGIVLMGLLFTGILMSILSYPMNFLYRLIVSSIMGVF
jgi:Zn-dependent protease